MFWGSFGSDFVAGVGLVETAPWRALFDRLYVPVFLFLVAPSVFWIVIRCRQAMIWHELVRRGTLCASCGYNLTGNTSGVCPECGTPTTAGVKA